MIAGPLLLLSLIAAAVAAAFWLDRHVPLLSKLGASLLVVILGATLSNTGVVPANSPVYGAIEGPVTSLAIAWLLLSVDIRDLRKVGGRMVLGFAIAVVGTALGSFVGALLFADTFGDQTWRLAGTMMGTYSGGGVNFAAVGRGLELPNELFVGALAADNATTGIWLAATLLLPVWLGRFYATPVPVSVEEGSDEGGSHPFFSPGSISTLDLGLLLAVGLALLAASEWLGSFTPGVPSVLWLTTLALVVGHTRAFSHPRGALQLGTLALHFFFAVGGIRSRVAAVMDVGVEVFLFTLVVVGIHGLFTFGVGRLARLDIATVAVSSQAAIGGPSSALAVVVAREWRALVLPGIIIGLLGYAVGNYLGFAVAYLVRGLGLGL